MAATDTFNNLDDYVRRIKDDCATQVADANHMRDAAVTEVLVLRDQLAKAAEHRDVAVRTTIKLLAQFSTVEAVFAEAKRLAMFVDATIEGNGIGDPRAAPTKHEEVPTEVAAFAPKPETKLLSAAMETLARTGK
jgi:hypothetical protein